MVSTVVLLSGRFISRRPCSCCPASDSSAVSPIGISGQIMNGWSIPPLSDPKMCKFSQSPNSLVPLQLEKKNGEFFFGMEIGQ